MRRMKMDSEVMVYTIMVLVIMLFILFLPQIDSAIQGFLEDWR